MTAGILLAAGESTRMGQLKALLPWRGTTLLQSQLSEMIHAELSPLLVVCFSFSNSSVHRWRVASRSVSVTISSG